MMNNKIYQMIFDEISCFLPSDWNKVVIYLEHGEESYSYAFYVKTDKDYIKCYDLEISEDELFAAFSRMEQSISKERNTLAEKWSNMTMIVDNQGNMRTDYDYTDFSQGNYQYKKIWKEKYPHFETYKDMKSIPNAGHEIVDNIHIGKGTMVRTSLNVFKYENNVHYDELPKNLKI